MIVPLGSTIAGVRRRIHILTASNAALAIPTWAQGGKGLMLVTGTGGGGGGGNDGAFSGSDGGSGAMAFNHPIPIPSGITTANIAIGAGGTAATSGNSGGTGGACSITLGSVVPLLLGGGSGGPSSNSPGTGGTPQVYGANFLVNAGSDTTGVTTLNMAAAFQTLARGIHGYASANLQPYGMNARMATPFGGASNGATPGSGYGYGGKGTSSGGGAAYAGGPGMLIIEFVEGY